MSVLRRSRAERIPGVQVRLNERDEQLLLALARFRLARTRDLTVLAFRDTRQDTAARRLRLLFDAGYLAVDVTDRAHENVYRLGPQGRQWVAARGGEVGRAPRRSVEHHLGIVREWVSLAVLSREMPIVRLARFRPDWEIRESLANGESAIVPDAVAELEVTTPSGEPVALPLALEVDLGTESFQKLTDKVEAYAHEALSGAGLFGDRQSGLAVALANASPQRWQGIDTLLETTWPGWSVVWDVNEGPTRAIGELVDAVTDSPNEVPLQQGGERVRNS